MICFVMVALAFIDGILGVFLPQIKPELGINDTQASAVFVVNLLGFCVFTSIGGHLCDKIGSRKSFFLLLGILGQPYPRPAGLVWHTACRSLRRFDISVHSQFVPLLSNFARPLDVHI